MQPPGAAAGLQPLTQRHGRCIKRDGDMVEELQRRWRSKGQYWQVLLHGLNIFASVSSALRAHVPI